LSDSQRTLEDFGRAESSAELLELTKVGAPFFLAALLDTIFSIATAQLLNVLLAIEENTRTTAER